MAGLKRVEEVSSLMEGSDKNYSTSFEEFD